MNNNEDKKRDEKTLPFDESMIIELIPGLKVAGYETEYKLNGSNNIKTIIQNNNNRNI